MSAHTPGPWHLRKSLTGSDYLHVSSQTIDRIAAVNRSEDAHLIAAAPDMLAALEGVVRVADRATDEFDAARAAIKKARGEA